MANEKVFVALSGGVDSAVSAALLKEQGYNVTGVYMKNWSGDDFGIQADCPWEKDQADAEAVCKHLGIPFMSFNFEKQYRDKVVEYFFNEYKSGRTPNPDVMCNKEIKFKLFLDRALEEGADLIATGHYARRIQNDELGIMNYELRKANDKGQMPNDQDYNLSSITYHLYTGIDNNKNQVYFLYNITQEQLSKTLFPIGEYTKPEVREMARKFGLPNAEKPDSQGICFIGEINVLKFLMANIPEKSGEIVDIDTNKVVGKHKGIYFYTIGQRHNLGVGGAGLPYYVVKKDGETDTLYVGKGHDHPALFKKEVELENVHWINGLSPTPLLQEREKGEVSAVIRYRGKPAAGRLLFSSPLPEIDSGQALEERAGGEVNDELGIMNKEIQKSKTKTKKLTTNNQQPTTNNRAYTFVFDEPQWAPASGQSLVLFRGEECLGGGIIR